MKPFRETLRSSEFAVTAELVLTPTQTIEDIVHQAQAATRVADAIYVPDHRDGVPHIPATIIGARLRDDDIEAIVRLNCRDRNKIAMQSELLAAPALGVRNLLISRGNSIAGTEPGGSEVHDMSPIEVVRTAAGIRDGEVKVDKSGGDTTELFIGTVATVIKPKKDWRAQQLAVKADAGAEFIQLQTCMNRRYLSHYAAHLIDARLTWRFQLLANLPVLHNADAAREVLKASAGAGIPAKFVKRMETAKDPEAEGVAIAAEVLHSFSDVPGISGANVTTTGDPSLIIAAIEASGVRNDVGT